MQMPPVTSLALSRNVISTVGATASVARTLPKPLNLCTYGVTGERGARPYIFHDNSITGLPRNLLRFEKIAGQAQRF